MTARTTPLHACTCVLNLFFQKKKHKGVHKKIPGGPLESTSHGSMCLRTHSAPCSTGPWLAPMAANTQRRAATCMLAADSRSTRTTTSTQCVSESGMVCSEKHCRKCDRCLRARCMPSESSSLLARADRWLQMLRSLSSSPPCGGHACFVRGGYACFVRGGYACFVRGGYACFVRAYGSMLECVLQVCMSNSNSCMNACVCLDACLLFRC
jgi:hypothetical protein